MRRSSILALRALLLAGVVSLLAPTTALAHALFADSDPNRPLGEYLWLGFLHMVTGWDHLLFIAGVVLLAGTLGRAAKVISLFVLGHSITLLTATLAGWQLDATAVDVVIALSLVYVGVQGVRGRPDNLRVFGTIVFAFGLVHGLGLSTRLQDLGLPDDGLVVRVLLFNIGVEIGQLAALTIIVGLGTLLARQIADPAEWSRVAYVALVAAGLIAAVVLGSSGGGDEDKAYAAGCTEDSTSPPEAPSGSHPAKSFYGPDEQLPGADFAHVVFDGYVVITYRENLRAADRNQLQKWIEGEKAAVVAGSLDDQKEAIRAVTARRELRCRNFDLETLTTFRDDWFASLQQ